VSAIQQECYENCYAILLQLAVCLAKACQVWQKHWTMPSQQMLDFKYAQNEEDTFRGDASACATAQIKIESSRDIVLGCAYKPLLSMMKSG